MSLIRQSTGLATGYSVHDLRHVAATSAISAGADVKLVQRMLGQKDATETLNTYAALWPDKVGEVADAIEARRAQALSDLNVAATDAGERAAEQVA